MRYILVITFAFSIGFAQIDTIPVDTVTTALQHSDTISIDSSKLDSIQVDSTQLDSTQIDSIQPDSNSLEAPKLNRGPFGGKLPPKATVEKSKLYPLSVHLKGQIKFLNFAQRDRFQRELDTRESQLKDQQIDPALSARIRAQDFQRVNLSFPIFMGFKYRPVKDWSLGASIGYFYHQTETLLLLGDQSQEWSYALEGFPVYVEFAHLIPESIITLDEVNYLQIGGRIYGHYSQDQLLHKGNTAQSRDQYGLSGWGAFLGYEYMSWNRLTIYAELEYSSQEAQSSMRWDSLTPISPTDPDKPTQEPTSITWDYGGIALSFNLEWNFGEAL